MHEESNNPDSSLAQLVEKNRELQRSVAELSLLNDLARSISAASNTEAVIREVVRQSRSAINCEQGVLTLVQSETDTGLKTLARSEQTTNQPNEYHFDDTLLGWMFLHMSPLRIDNPAEDERFLQIHWNSSIHSLLAVPVMVKARLIGVLTVYNKQKGETFSDDDQRLLSIIAAQSAQIIENKRLYEEERSLQELRCEMEVAARIQGSLLPAPVPPLGMFQAVGENLPAMTVGGDFYDIFPLPDGKLGLMIGDVVGKGMPAALFMAVCLTLFRTEAVLISSPAELLSILNHKLGMSNPLDMFSTMIYAILDPVEQTLTISNGGHPPPIIVHRNGETEIPEITSTMVIGMLDDVQFEEQKYNLAPGDSVVFYTDGVPETENINEDMFGIERFQAILRENRLAAAPDLLRISFQEVELFRKGCPPSDDVTVVILRHTG